MTQAFISIVTHDGSSFHTDECVAIAILTTIFKNYEVIRTRDVSVINECDFAVDVGDVYNHQLRRYDHHMQNPPTDDNGHVYSSAGLIWKHYADAYLTSIGIPKNFNLAGTSIDLRSEVKRNILNRWILPIDMVDNGNITGPTVVSELVKSLRPIFDERTRDKCNEQFLKAVDLISSILKRACFHAADYAIKCLKFMKGKKILVSEGRVLLCDTEVQTINQFCGTDILFVVFPIQEYCDEEQTKYIINPVPIAPRRNLRINIPTELLGARGETIEQLTGCSGVFYIHHTGFVMMAYDKDAAIKFCDYLISLQ